MMTRRFCPRAAPLALVAAIVACLVLGLAPSAQAGDPSLVWRTLETDHFIINYYTLEERLAQRLAIAAEAAHRKLAPLLDHTPRWKTQVVLSDGSDDANGSATVLPTRVVSLFATSPDDRSELNDYDDWISALITHEYTHILHLDTVHGVARVVNAILGFGERGQLYAPNQSQPRFIIEGLAVFEESERTTAGRLRSTIFDMYTRTATVEGKFQRLDQFTNYPLQWPRGNSPYLYGSAFLRYIASLYGQDVFRRLSHEYGGSWLPGGINRALRRVTGGKGVGRTFSDLYDGFRASMKERYDAQVAAIDARGRLEGVALTPPFEYMARPVFSGDGQSVLWAGSDAHERPRIYRMPVAGGRPQTEHFVDAAGTVAATRDGSTLYLSAMEVHRTLYYWNDLFRVDRATGERTQLTHGLRAVEVDLSPDERTLAFEVNEVGSRSLCTMPVEGGPVRRLIDTREDLTQIYTPAWSPDGKQLAFSWWREGGYRDIWTLDLASGARTRITADRALDLEPRYSPDGKYLYFSSDRTGVYNLYAYELATQRTFQVTNVVGGVFDAAISPDGKTAVYIGFVADGYRLERLALDPTRFRPAIEPLLDRPEAEPTPPSQPLPSRPYQPIYTMAPYTWTGSSYPDAFGQVLALSVGGGDITGRHAFSASLGIGTGRADDVSFSAAYTYAGAFPALSISGYRQLTRRGGFYVDGVNHGYVEDDWSGSLGVSLPILRTIQSGADLAFNYNLVSLKNLDRNKLPLDPNLISPKLPEEGIVSSLGMSFSYSNLRRYTYSISAEQGRALSFSLGVSQKAIGSQYNAYTASWRWLEYVPLTHHHVLQLIYAGGIAGGDFVHRGSFAVGGYAPQADFFRSLFDFSRPGSAALRGYPQSSVGGSQFHALSAEYRFPIWHIERGYDTFPVYFKALHGAAFVDSANAFDGNFDWRQIKLGAGVEVRLETYLFYYFGASLQLGYARGFMAGGTDQVYFLLNNPF